MRFFILLTALISFVLLTPAPVRAAEQDRVLLVVSGHGADGGKTRPGFEMDELTQAWLIFRDNGLAVDIASPAGGEVVADEFNAAKPYNQRFLADPAASAKLKATRPLAGLRRQSYAAIFVIGGKGAMFDLPVNTDLKQLITATWEAGGVIGAVCHGPAVLMNINLPNGAGLIAGRRVTGFSNEEESLFGSGWAPSFPVLLENGLRGAGAIFGSAPMMLNHVVTDGRLVTGQNPYSTAAAAEAVLQAMGRTPVTRVAWQDEATINAVHRIIKGEGSAIRALLQSDPGQFDVRLMAMWGVHRAKNVGTDRAELMKAVEVMEVAETRMKAPQLATAIAAGRARLAGSR